MSIFGIIGICLLLSVAFFALLLAIDVWIDEEWFLLMSIAISVCIFIIGIFVGIGINTRQEQIYINKYLIQKETIEISIHDENITDLSKTQLIKLATELNGELAEHKTKYNYWHYVYYDKSLYDDVDFINLK